METLNYIIMAIELLLVTYFGFAAVYFFVFAFASLFYRTRKSSRTDHCYSVAVLLPSYKEDRVIVESTISALGHVSKRATISVFVGADSLSENTLKRLNDTGAHIVKLAFEKSTKSKALKQIMKQVPITTDYVVVLDADNIMSHGFIDAIAGKLDQGFHVVQGHRIAKNTNTGFAILDALSEEVNNSIFRQGHRVLGLSSSIIGSGFACERGLFASLMERAEAVGGFDKEIEVMLLRSKTKIAYAKDAVVLDEKIQHSDAFVTQRRRWLSAQFVYFGRNIVDALRHLILRGNIDYFDKLLQFMVPPRILALGFSFMLVVLHLLILFLFHNQLTSVLFFVWLGISMSCSLAIALAIPRKMYNALLIKALWSIPIGFLLTLKALLKSKGANKSFLHTSHGV